MQRHHGIQLQAEGMLAKAKGVAVVAHPVPGAAYTVPAFAKRPLCPDQHATDKRLHADELADAR